MAYETPLTIAEVMRDISNNKYVLPSIQREYVWDTEQIETLFDSLMQDYPIGAFLFWEIEKSRITISMNSCEIIMRRTIHITRRLISRVPTVLPQFLTDSSV